MARVKKSASGKRQTLGGGGPARRKWRGESLIGKKVGERRKRENGRERENV
jgi:hypothetical protein